MQFRDLTHEELKDFPDYDGHETVRAFEDASTGLIAYIGIHNSNRGPGLGGCRVRAFADEKDAIRDVLRLSRGMTYKNAVADLPLGGGKAVIIADPHTQKTEALMRAMGRAVETLQGRYITAEDSGSNEQDMIAIAQETSYVTGIPDPDSDIGGDPSPFTAHGVFVGIREAVKYRYEHEDMSKVTVAVQGVGAVGYHLCKKLSEAGARLIVTDVSEKALKRVQEHCQNVTVVEPSAIFAQEAHIFAPCALGAQINDDTIPQFKFDIIAGAANNQLATRHHGEILVDKDILYIPDYVLNPGGVIAVGYEYFKRAGQSPFGHDINYQTLIAHIDHVGPTITKILDLSKEEDLIPSAAADQLAESLFMKKAA